MSDFKMQMFKKQKGTVLLMSLVFLLILTILGLSSMQNAILETKIANNYNQANYVFQAAESAINSLSSNPPAGKHVPQVVEDALNSNAAIPTSALITVCLDVDNDCDDFSIDSKGRVRYLDDTPANGYSLGLYVNYHFNFTGEGSIPDPDDAADRNKDLSRSLVSRGGSVIAPK